MPLRDPRLISFLVAVLFTAFPSKGDWLIQPVAQRASVVVDNQTGQIVLDNGLIRRTIKIAPNAATCGFDNLMNGQSILRGVKPEAVVEINGHKVDVGGLIGQPNYAYLKPQWLAQMKRDPAAFGYASFETGKTVARFPWARKHGATGAPGRRPAFR